jgi:beta-galactosidase
VRAAGVRYDEFSNLHADLPLRTTPDSTLRLPDGAVATRWVEGLAVEDAEVLAEYDHPHFGRWPAVTTRRHGAGHVTCVGTVPGRELARALAEWLTPSARHPWRDLPASVTATTGTASDGRRVHIVHNWSWEPARVDAPADLTDVLNGTPLPAGAPLDLGPWDVRVFVSADAAGPSGA